MPLREIIRDPDYLVWLRDQSCIITGQSATEYESVVPMHVGTAGKGIKSSDDEVLPVLNSVHQEGHHGSGGALSGGEISMLRRRLPDSILRLCIRAFARELYQDYLKTEGKSL